MARIDTAGFWKYGSFYWHSKANAPEVIVIPDDPIVEPDPCDKCPSWYTCDWNWVCQPPSSWWPWTPKPPIDNRPPDEEEDKRIITNPSQISRNYCCHEYSLSSWWSIWWYTKLENWYITWADANSWVRYYYSWDCYTKVIYEWRLTEKDSTWYNRIEYWFWDLSTKDISIKNVSSVDARNANDRFRVTLDSDWNYKIEVARVIDATRMYDRAVYKEWNCRTVWDAAWVLNYSVPMWMIIWVNGRAMITWETKYKVVPEVIRELYSSARWTIRHNVTRQEITLTKDNWQSITIMDRNLWATKYYNESWATASEWYWNFYQWWNNYWFPESWWVSTSWTQVDASWYSCSNPYSSSTFITSTEWSYWDATHQDWASSPNDSLWSRWCQWPCPEWFHIPSSSEAITLLDYWSYITWIERNNKNTFNASKRTQLCNNLLMPINWYRRFNWWYVASRTGSNGTCLLRTTGTTTWNVSSDSWYCIYVDNYWAYVWSYESWADYPIPYGKIDWLAIRPFKNTN